MRKILSGLLGVVMTASVVGGVAYAAFTAQATVNGIDITAGTAALKVGAAINPASNIFSAGLVLAGVYPGYSQNTTFVVKNEGTVNLTITGQLTGAGGWNDAGVNLKDYVEVAVNTSDDSLGTGYLTLVNWNSGAIAFPGTAIAPGDNRTYKVYVRVPASAPDLIQGQSLTNITFTLIGTQQ